MYIGRTGILLIIDYDLSISSKSHIYGVINNLFLSTNFLLITIKAEPAIPIFF